MCDAEISFRMSRFDFRGEIKLIRLSFIPDIVRTRYKNNIKTITGFGAAAKRSQQMMSTGSSTFPTDAADESSTD